MLAQRLQPRLFPMPPIDDWAPHRRPRISVSALSPCCPVFVLLVWPGGGGRRECRPPPACVQRLEARGVGRRRLVDPPTWPAIPPARRKPFRLDLASSSASCRAPFFLCSSPFRSFTPRATR